MPNKLAVIVGAVPVALLLVTQGSSKDDGVLPSGSGSSTSMTRNSGNSCGKCHSPNQPIGTRVSVMPAQRALTPGQTIGVTVRADNSAVSSSKGGFAADVTAGTLVAGATSRVRGDGLAITHANDQQRQWTFNYRAPTTPGLVEMYTVAMAANGNRSKSGDEFAFHGSDPANGTSTPVRMFVNAAGVKAVGTSCDDGYGNYSVLGAPVSATVGGPFRLEAHGLPPSSRALLMLSIGGNVPPFDMAMMGAPGCVLRTTLQIEVSLVTSGGNAARAEGKVILPAAVPNDPKLKGLVLSMQVGALDSKPKRSFPMIVTNALEVSIL